MRIMPLSSRSPRSSLFALGISLVISSGPSFVSRASISYSSMCMEVYTSSRTIFSLSSTEPSQVINPISAFLPRDISPFFMPGPSAITEPSSTLSPTSTMGTWFIQVLWFEGMNLIIS